MKSSLSQSDRLEVQLDYQNEELPVVDHKLLESFSTTKSRKAAWITF